MKHPDSIKGDMDAIADYLGKSAIKPLKPITLTVARIKDTRNLLAQVEIPLSYAGEHWITVDVHGELESGPDGKILSDMRCSINGQDADKFLPETLKQQIANEVIRGDFD